MPILGIDASRAVRKEKTGVEWYSYFLLAAMQRCTPEGWKVRCYVPEENEKLKMQNEKWSWKVLRWPGRGWTQGRLSLEMMKSPPDVLFVPSHVIPLFHPARTITTVHDVVFLRRPELYDPQDLEAQRRGLEFALKFARKIIVPSKATRDEVVAAGGRPEQIVVVPHGVESADIRNSILDIRAQSEYPISNIKYPYILFIGRIERKKNVLGLIHALRRVLSRFVISSGVSGANEVEKSHTVQLASASHTEGVGSLGYARDDKSGDLKLVLAGSLGYGGEDVPQAIKTFKLQDHVIHLGYVDRAQYLDLLKHAALLVLPSFGEGFGLPVLEAMASGIPVVCSDIPALHEVGGNAVQYVNPRDPQDIAHGMETVLQNEMLHSEMVRRGKEFSAQYSWDKTARETWEVIQRL